MQFLHQAYVCRGGHTQRISVSWVLSHWTTIFPQHHNKISVPDPLPSCSGKSHILTKDQLCWNPTCPILFSPHNTCCQGESGDQNGAQMRTYPLIITNLSHALYNQCGRFVHCDNTINQPYVWKTELIKTGIVLSNPSHSSCHFTSRSYRTCVFPLFAMGSCHTRFHRV